MGLDSHATVAVATMEMAKEWGIMEMLEPTSVQLQVAGGVAAVEGTAVLVIHYGPGPRHSLVLARDESALHWQLRAVGH